MNYDYQQPKTEVSVNDESIIHFKFNNDGQK